MTLATIASQSSVFVDANILVYALAPDPKFGPECADFLERIEQQELNGFTSSQVLSDVAHRLMTLEACATSAGRMQGLRHVYNDILRRSPSFLVLKLRST